MYCFSVCVKLNFFSGITPGKAVIAETGLAG